MSNSRSKNQFTHIRPRHFKKKHRSEHAQINNLKHTSILRKFNGRKQTLLSKTDNKKHVNQVRLKPKRQLNNKSHFGVDKN